MASKGEPPAFLQYAGDWIAETAGLTAAERGVLMTLRAQFWLLRSLPVDEAKLARLAGVSRAELRRVWPAIADWFCDTVMAPGVLIEPELAAQRDALEIRRADQTRKANERWERERRRAAGDAQTDLFPSGGAASENQVLAGNPPESADRGDASALPLDMPGACLSLSSSSPRQINDPQDHSHGSAPARAPASVSLSRINELWMAQLNTGPFTQGLELVHERIEFYARSPKAAGRSAEAIAVAAIAAFVQVADSFEAGYRPAKTGYKFADHWPRVEALLDGAPPEARAQKPGAGPTIVANLDFKRRE